MATGCAVMILQGATFEEFVLKYGVIAGAQMVLHSPPADPESPGAGLVASELRTLQAELAAYECMTEEAAQIECDAEHELAVIEWRDRIATREAKRARYTLMIARLHAWSAPGPVFEDFKVAMIADVERSMASDCDSRPEREPMRLTPNEWRVQQIAEKQSAIEHLQRTAARYAWMHELRASLGLSADASAPI